jgi:transposase-like protein
VASVADAAKVKKWKSQAREYAERAEAAAERAEAAAEQLTLLHSAQRDSFVDGSPAMDSTAGQPLRGKPRLRAVILRTLQRRRRR